MPLVTRTSSNSNVFKGSTEPDDKTAGNIWINTGTTPPSMSFANGTDYVDSGFRLGADSTVISVGGLV